MNGIGTQIEPIEISDDEAPRGQKRKRDISESIQETSEKYKPHSRSANPLRSSCPSENAPSNPTQSKRPRLSADNNPHLAYLSNMQSNRRPMVEELSIHQIPSSGIEDIVIQLDEWPTRRADSVIIKPKKKKERVIECRQKFKASDFNRTSRFKIDLFQTFELFRPYIQSHVPPVHRQFRASIYSKDSEIFTWQTLKRLSCRVRLRSGGCPMSIAQTSGHVVIAANAYGIDHQSDSVSPANHNGVTVLNAGTGNRLVAMTPGHARILNTTERRNERNRINSPIDENKYVFEGVLDVQFDPARLTLNNSIHSPTSFPSVQITSIGELKMMKSQHMQLRMEEGKSSLFRSFHLRFFNGYEIECPIDNRKGQQISSIIWGVGPTKNVIFAGTESQDFETNTTTGKQSGYLITNDGRYMPWKYTGAQEEVQQLTLNPSGDIIASFTRGCDTDLVLCQRCKRRGISSQHTLSLYSVNEMRDRLPQNSDQNRIAHVQLPSFTRFNNADIMSESGLVVSAAWSPCGTYISAARDDDTVDLYDHRFLQPKPLMRLEHTTPPMHHPKLRKAFDLTGRESQCCVVVKKHPDHGVTGMQWIQRGGYFAGMSLVTAGSDGAVRLWDVKQNDKNAILAQLETGIACLTIGDPSKREIPLIVADNDGLIELYNIY
ncbi:hypothetical protein CPB86DRAFT_809679 [Serendipita vermifera]|nr:hypothetical protein CPB86DRAFT_809679 [Serendipita vermifera]